MAPYHGWASHQLEAFRCEPCWNDRDCWWRIWTCRNGGWAMSDVRISLGARFMAYLAHKYYVEDRAGLCSGRVFFVRNGIAK